jgi:hypothetical protein
LFAEYPNLKARIEALTGQKATQTTVNRPGIPGGSIA